MGHPLRVFSEGNKEILEKSRSLINNIHHFMYYETNDSHLSEENIGKRRNVAEMLNSKFKRKVRRKPWKRRRW